SASLRSRQERHRSARTSACQASRPWGSSSSLRRVCSTCLRRYGSACCHGCTSPAGLAGGGWTATGKCICPDRPVLPPHASGCAATDSLLTSCANCTQELSQSV